MIANENSKYLCGKNIIIRVYLPYKYLINDNMYLLLIVFNYYYIIMHVQKGRYLIYCIIEYRYLFI